MAELRKITKRAPLSGFSRVGPEGGSAFKAFADVAQQGYQLLKPALDAAEAEYGAEVARRQIGQNAYPLAPQSQPTTAGGGDLSGFSPDTLGQSGGLLGLIDRTEGGGNYATLFGHAQREGGAFAGVDVSKMSIAQVLDFTKPTGAYAQWVAKQVGRVATPTGRFQIVGSTLRNAVKALGLGMDAAFDATTQDKIAGYLAANRLRSASTPEGKRQAMRAEWEGFKHVSDAELDRAIADFEGKGSSIGVEASEFTQGTAPTVPVESAAEVLAPATPPTLVRTSEGKIEPRMHSPLAEGLMLATSAAAQTGYLSEMLVQGGTDIMGLSQNFAGNPAGFQQAAQAYIDQAVKAAPAMMKGELRSRLTQDSQRRYLGIMEEHQREVRQRANNSSTALYQRYQNDYAEALAAGNFDEAASARGLLEDILTARESLPGVAWTREQSENVILGAQDTAARIAEQNRQKVSAAVGGELDVMIQAADAGRRSGGETILDDPRTWELHPEKAREAASKIALREALPGFYQLPPSEMDAVIAQEAARPVGEGWELDLLKPMKDARDLAMRDLASDPITYAQERLAQKPPAIDTINMEDPQSFISSLAARRDYANGMVEAGFVATPAFLSKAEIGTLSAALAKTSPVEMRAAVAGAIVSGFGEDAAQVFKALNTDAVTTWGGALMAKGGPGNIVAEALQGQAIIDQRLAQMPEENNWRSIMQNDFRGALAGLPIDSIQAEAELMQFAKALYANRAAAPGFDGDEDVMRDAIQAALGQSRDPRGEPIGGIQDFFGHQTLMPLGVNADTVEKAFQDAMAVDWGVTRAVDGAPLDLDASSNLEFWSNISIQQAEDGSFVSGGAPRIGGEFLPLSMIRNGDVRFVPVGGTQYRMEVQRSGAVLDVHTPEGALYIIDLARI